MADETRRQRYRKRLAQLKSERASWDTHWSDIIDYVMPRRGNVRGDQTATANRGDKRQQLILDGTATRDLGTLASGLMTGVTSPARPWFNLATPDKDLNDWAPAKRWLEAVRDRMGELFRSSNLYNCLPEHYRDLGGIGTAAMGAFEDDKDVFRFYPYPTGEYWLATDSRRVVDTFYRTFAMTVRQLVQEYGFDACSTKVQADYRAGSTERMVLVTQVIEPNEQYDAKRLHARYKRFASCHYEEGCEEDKLLRESGFDEFPILAPRWTTIGPNVYGESPLMDVLPDVKALQVLERRKAQGIEKQVDPPLLAPADLANGSIDTRPGRVNYYDRRAGAGGQQIAPLYQVQFDLRELRADIAEKQRVVHDSLYASLFLMLAMDARNQPPTAEEIKARQEEKLLALGPVLERLNDELLDPLIGRCFAIMAKRDLLPPPPEELQGLPLGVEYVSVMAQAQKLVGLGAQERLIGHIGNLAALGFTDALDKVDIDREIDEYADKVGASARIVRSADEVAKIRQNRAAMQQRQQAMANMQAAAKSARDLAAAPLDSDNALTAIAGGRQGIA
jgi:hypothetical protein